MKRIEAAEENMANRNYGVTKKSYFQMDLLEVFHLNDMKFDIRTHNFLLQRLAKATTTKINMSNIDDVECMYWLKQAKAKSEKCLPQNSYCKIRCASFYPVIIYCVKISSYQDYSSTITFILSYIGCQSHTIYSMLLLQPL